MKYQLTIQVPYEAMDDIEARQKMSEILSNIQKYTTEELSSKKLQELFDNKPPRKVHY